MADLYEKTISCPYCNAPNGLLIDTSLSEQSYIEDCQVCCQPMLLDVVVDDTDMVEVYARQENE